MIRAFVQARMSSQRFPGKVLAPLGGQPVLKRLLEKIVQVVPLSSVVVLTSVEPSDDPLACYAQSLGVPLYRGELENVAKRFFHCLCEYPCDWFIRLCADSPLLDATVLKTLTAYQERWDLDLVTNVYPRTFPKGYSVEMVKAESFATLDVDALSAEEKEHVTAVFYRRPQRFRILNVTSGDPRQAGLSYAVDTLEDLKRLEALGNANGWWEETKG
ncbi:MAG: NTP transferase domain-containing protein [Candidatus Binatia bacterium]